MAARELFAVMNTAVDRLRLREGAVIIAMLLATMCTWGFVELADEVVEGETQAFDEWAVRAMRRADDAIGSPVLPEVARDVTALGSVSVLALMIIAAAGYLLIRRQYRAMWFTLAATISGAIISSVLKEFFSRERPSVVPHLTDVDTASFPSGHSMLSAVVYLTLGSLLMRATRERRAKIYIFGVALIMAMLIGVTRIYLGVHYPTDVLAGWTAGMTWAAVCWLVEGYLQRHGTVEGER